VKGSAFSPQKGRERVEGGRDYINKEVLNGGSGKGGIWFDRRLQLVVTVGREREREKMRLLI